VSYGNDSFSLPRIVRTGMSVQLRRGALMYIEGVHASDAGLDVRTGLEVSFRDVLYLRGGYMHPVDNDPDMGSGFGLSGGIGLMIAGYTVDYAMVPFDDFGLTHRISVGFRFS